MLSCALFYSTKQPLLSQNQESIQQFNESTSFPYLATEERRESILFYYKKLRVGMNGDEVLNVMGNPDETFIIAFVGDPPRGWKWSYNIFKKFESAVDDTDINVTLYFDIEGKVKKILPQNIK